MRAYENPDFCAISRIGKPCGLASLIIQADTAYRPKSWRVRLCTAAQGSGQMQDTLTCVLPPARCAVLLQNVSYIVDAVPADGSPTIVCKGPSPYDRMWSNASGVPSMPEFSVLGGRQWGYACPWQPTDNPNDPNYPSGQVCVAWGNPDIGGYRNFDNILLAWIMVLQHMATQVRAG